MVGARCAGSPTAMLLARMGHKVLLVDRATFPSDTMSTHLLKVPAVAALERWGLLEEVLRSANCPPISEATFDVGDFSLTGSPLLAGNIAGCFSPRRVHLDEVLVEAAIEAGADLREGFSVREVLADGSGRVTGVRGREAAGGAIVSEKARIVVGADGLRSIVARAVKPPAYRTRHSLTCAYYSYWSGACVEGLLACPRDRRMVISFPTGDGLSCVYVAWPRGEFRGFRSDVEGNFLETLELVPALAERVRAGRREECFVGTATLPNYFRKPHGPGWALVGDAGYHKDPLTAQGITDAFRDAELLAEAIDAGLWGKRPMEEALAGYERRRNEAAVPVYDNTCRRAALDPAPSEARKLFAALRGNQEETERFLDTIFGTVPIDEFFSPENVRQITGAA